ncbi:MAG: A/G-specific adenine glycosylase [Paucibacter sp.]|nr:A/G-specific adenine glycosylase [Roseateles sp.]
MSSLESPPARAGAKPDFGRTVVQWQRHAGRHDLPWQRTQDPYRVWLSEIMLQQTQVTTVLGYYERFLARFADVRALAAASLDEVLALWAGLGYYSRARNLHRCAIAVVELHNGEFPRTAAVLAELPGIGRSTAAAIAAFCFGERVAILDGNVKRVLSRVLAFDGDLAQARAERALWDEASALLPAAGIEAYTQGLMDLGAGVCSVRRPDCGACPVAPQCDAHAAGTQERYPVRTRKLKRSRRENWWLWLEQGGRVLLQQRPAEGVWAGLWSLPMFDDEAALLSRSAGTPLEVLPRIEHALTHFDWVLHTRRAELDPDFLPSPDWQGQWVAREELAQYALPAPLKKLIHER